MLSSYLPILLLGGLVGAFGVLSLAASRLLRPRRPTPAKLSPYECGIEPERMPRTDRFPVKFYLVAMLFIIFDIETVFLIPWGTIYMNGGGTGGGPSTGFLLVEMLVFMLILAVGYVYVWKRGALQWD
jgi:NADH-quinone oxidoreductase subunit A